METTVSLMYKDARAIYMVKEERRGIFSASLRQYEGSTHCIPPPNILLTKGVRHWVGSIDDEVLINEIGEIIDRHLQPDSSLKPSGELVKDRQADGTGKEVSV